MLGDICRSDSRLLKFSTSRWIWQVDTLRVITFSFFDGGKDIVYYILMSLEERDETKLLSISSQYNSHPTILVNETSSSSLQTHFRRPFFFSSQNVTYPDRQMCWSTSLYSSPTKPPSLFRSAIFRYERRDVKLGLEKKKILFLFEKVLLTDSHLSGGKPCQLLRVFSVFAETPTGFLDSITGTC